VKIALTGKRFQDAEDIKTADLNDLPLEFFADCFHKLVKQFNKYI
jgi:hypothetical protein